MSKQRYARVRVDVTYYADVELPDDCTDPKRWIGDNWELYDDDLIAETTKRSVVEMWTDDDDDCETDA